MAKPTKARIFRPAKTAMQSGTRNTAQWTVEFEPRDDRFIEHLMGWTGSEDTTQQVRMRFDTKPEAIRFCEKHKLEYTVTEPRRSRFKPKSYEANFSTHRIDTYRDTHSG